MMNQMTINLFFTGYKTHFKKYESYFPNLNFISDPVPSNIIECIKSTEYVLKAMTHSVGLIKALNFCMINGIKSMKILAIDPPDSSDEEIIKKLNDENLPIDLRIIYNEYMELKKVNDFPKVQICLYRNRKNMKFNDIKYYDELNYYLIDTHYPYTLKKLRDQIVRLYEKM